MLDWYIRIFKCRCVVCTVVCTGLVCCLMCCMYWTGVLYVLDWCVVCTGLVCCMYWTGVLYVIHTHDIFPVACFRTRGGGGGEISPKIVRMLQVSSTAHHHPPSLIKVQGQCFTPSLLPHTTHQSSTYNGTYYTPPVQYIHHTRPVQHTQSSTSNTPNQYIHPTTSPVYTTHQSCTPVHTSHMHACT